MDFSALLHNVLNWLYSSGIRIVIIVILMIVAFKIAGILSRRIFAPLKMVKLEGESQKRADTLSSLVRYVLNITILAVALVMILGEFGIDIGPIIAAAGIVGLAVGFGAQNLVKDIISGFFILLEDQVRVGDVVQIGGKAGLVERVNLRMVVLRDLSGSVHFIRNGDIDVVTNMTKDYSFSVFSIGVAYREDVDQVIEVVKELGDGLRNDSDYKDDILEPIEILGLDSLADSAVIIKARFKTPPGKQWRIAREFNRRMKRRFDELSIEIPFPHLTMYMGENKDGSSAPLNVNLNDKRAQ